MRGREVAAKIVHADNVFAQIVLGYVLALQHID